MTYLPGDSPIHRADARIKLALLLAFSVCAFFVETWAGLGVLFASVAVAMAVARIPLGRMAALSLPLAFILAIIVLCNAFAFDAAGSAGAYTAIDGVSVGFAAGIEPVAIGAGLAFVPQGCMRGLFYAARILLIFWGSFILVFTTTVEALTLALSRLLAPLRAVRFPVDDAAMTLSLALRFIPLMAQELAQVKQAQASRGAAFDTGSLWARVRTWTTVLLPLFVSLFRRADRLALAMEARCYGAGRRTSLHEDRITFSQAASAVALVVLLAALALLA